MNTTVERFKRELGEIFISKTENGVALYKGKEANSENIIGRFQHEYACRQFLKRVLRNYDQRYQTGDLDSIYISYGISEEGIKTIESMMPSAEATVKSEFRKKFPAVQIMEVSEPLNDEIRFYVSGHIIRVLPDINQALFFMNSALIAGLMEVQHNEAV